MCSVLLGLHITQIQLFKELLHAHFHCGHKYREGIFGLPSWRISGGTRFSVKHVNLAINPRARSGSKSHFMRRISWRGSCTSLRSLLRGPENICRWNYIPGQRCIFSRACRRSTKLILVSLSATWCRRFESNGGSQVTSVIGVLLLRRNQNG